MSNSSSQSRAERLQELFDQFIVLTRVEQGAFLDEHCVDDPEMRSELEALRVADEGARGFLAGPTISTARVTVTTTENELRQVGPYKLVHTIGEGGFGTVYLAEQQEPVRRRVAVKVIKLGMDTREVIARFEAERQALAIMDHPNIASVFDAGATENGRPYFVMELVNGVPITQYCDANRLTARQRLELFIPVCQAVQHAHQKGVIHRDIKPNNILVTLHDGKPVPKIIDFGVAKATQARLTEKTLFTELRTMIGTPEYMSPEQAEMSGLDVDTRSDVYSLGVVLYELLTGATPFDPRELRRKAFAEMQRVIREVDPPRPSTRLSTIGTLASIAAQRSVEPKALHSLVRGELDWIVMRCLEKDRTRRYESASALAADVQHYLSDEPVAASPASRRYRARKFVQRNKGPVVALAAILLALVAGVIGTTIGLVGQSRQRAIAEQRQIEAQAQAEAAKREAAISNAMMEFQAGMLSSADPSHLLGDRVTVVQVMSSAVRELDAGKFKAQPLVEASVRETIGSTLRALGRSDLAEPILRKSLELRRAHAPAGDRVISASLSNLGLALVELGKFDEAQPMLRESVSIMRAIDPNHSDTAMSLSNLGLAYLENHFPVEAEPLFREALVIDRRVLQEGDLTLSSHLSNLAGALIELGKLDEAIALHREALDQRRRALPPRHPSIADSLNNLAEAITWKGPQFNAEGEALYREALEIYRSALPADHPNLAKALINLGRCLKDGGKPDQAEPLLREALAINRRALPASNPLLLNSVMWLGLTLLDQRKFADAEPLLLEGEQIYAQSPRMISRRQRCIQTLIELYRNWDKAEPGKGHDEQAHRWQEQLGEANRKSATSAPSH